VYYIYKLKAQNACTHNDADGMLQNMVSKKKRNEKKKKLRNFIVVSLKLHEQACFVVLQIESASA
jgi:hypothetical protein